MAYAPESFSYYLSTEMAHRKLWFFNFTSESFQNQNLLLIIINSCKKLKLYYWINNFHYKNVDSGLS